MGKTKRIQFDHIGNWSEMKLDIVKEYAKAYSTILSAQKNPSLSHAYIDAFAGSGLHISRRTGEFVLGSPLTALNVEPPFRDYHLIDLDLDKVTKLRNITQKHDNVFIYEGDCNSILLEEIFPKVRYENYRRALCLLDPYGLHLDWQVIEKAGRLGSIEVFLNFPVMDMNRNVLWRNPQGVAAEDIDRMNAYWGDETWREIAYTAEGDLFGHPHKEDTKVVADAYRKRLHDIAGFGRVSEPFPMRNSKGAIVYYLFFASPKPVALNIVKEIFNKYR
jgi:three-Cys-motif partner protein